MSEKREIRAFFYGLFGCSKRRVAILLRWHTLGQLFGGKSLRDEFGQFVEAILYEPIQVRLTRDHLYVFKNKALAIPFTWLTEEEQYVVATWVPYFKTRREYEKGHFQLSKFRYNDEWLTRDWERIVDVTWRREIVRDFVWYIVSRPDLQWMQIDLFMAIQHLLLSRADPFLAAIHDGMSGKVVLSEVLAWNNAATDKHSDVKKNEAKYMQSSLV
jgi:hypothetical protein